MENTKEVLHKIMTLSSILFEKTAPGGKALDFGWHSDRSYIPGGAATCSEGFVYFFLRVPQAAGLYCSCHAAQASKGNFHKTFCETFFTT